MRSRFAPLAGEAIVFRVVRAGGGFLPEGQRLPKPEWLEPTAEDQKDGEARGRPPGLSVWDEAVASLDDACWFRGMERDAGVRSFSIQVAAALAVGQRHARELTVVCDPESIDQDAARWRTLTEERQQHLVDAAQGHSLIEGLRRPAGGARKPHRSLLLALTEAFKPTGL